MKWFKEVFIKSLDEKFNEKQSGSIWITEKQVSICLKYMKPVSVYTSYFIVIGDYQYTMSIMKKGYGRLTREDKRVAIR